VEDHFEVFEQTYDEAFERQYGFFGPIFGWSSIATWTATTVTTDLPGSSVPTAAMSTYWPFRAKRGTSAPPAIKNGWWNSANGFAAMSLRQYLTGMSS
jgi:hypothetical protein